MPIDTNLKFNNYRELMIQYLDLKNPMIDDAKQVAIDSYQNISDLDFQMTPQIFLQHRLNQTILKELKHQYLTYQRYLNDDQLKTNWKFMIEQHVYIKPIEAFTEAIFDNPERIINQWNRVHGIDYRHDLTNAKIMDHFNAPTMFNRYFAMAAQSELIFANLFKRQFK